MNNKTNDRDIILFLGSGFSTELDFPTMAQFRDKAKEEFEKEKNEWASMKKQNWIALFSDSGRIYESFNIWCNSHSLPFKKNDDNLEFIFSVAEMLKNIVNSIALNGNLILSKDLVEKIKIWIWKNYQRFAPLDPKRKYLINEKPYFDFFEFLFQKNLIKRVSFLTTNYDLSIEYYANKLNLPIYYPISNYKPLFFSSNSKPFTIINDESIPILKIHGSINYFEKGKDFFIADRNDSPNNDARPEIFWMSNAFYVLNTQGMSPCIVAPSFNKTILGDWHQDIWSKAFEFVKHAKHIIFIGYSLTETDLYIRYFFRTAYANRTLKEGLRITIINPSCSVKKEYKEVFQKPLKVVFLRKKFSESVTEIDLKEIFKQDFW